MRLEHIHNALVEAFDHAIGSGRSGLGQTVLNAQMLAQLTKLASARRLAFAGGKESVREQLLLERSSAENSEPEPAGRNPEFKLKFESVGW